jgi:ATP-binding cassette subfamily B protein
VHDCRYPFFPSTWLALATLPLPFIGWMIHVVRDKLRTGFERSTASGRMTNVLSDTIPHPGGQVLAQEKARPSAFGSSTSRTWRSMTRLNKVWSLFTPTVSCC